MALTISRVLALPATPVANTIYLVGKTASELQLVVVGTNPTDIRSTIVGSDVDSKISTAIAALDLSNSAEFAATIAARDALTQTKNAFVFVADASADPAVGSGAALYFYNIATTSYTLVSDYKSMNIDIAGIVATQVATIFPNEAQLKLIGQDAGGNLTYGGAVVGTVQAGATEW